MSLRPSPHCRWAAARIVRTYPTGRGIADGAWFRSLRLERDSQRRTPQVASAARPPRGRLRLHAMRGLPSAFHCVGRSSAVYYDASRTASKAVRSA